MTDSTGASQPGVSISVRQVELSAGDSPQRHREKLARIVLDEMFQFVALLDVDGRLLEVNRAALEGGGIRLADIQNKPFWEARWWTVAEKTQEELKAAIRRAAEGEFIRYDVEVYGGSSGHETIIIDFSLLPVVDTAGSVVFLLAEGRDISEKKRAEAEIARKNQELERLLTRVRELDDLKSQVFANVSHELRTPLALILGPAERLLKAGDNLTATQRRDVDVMRRNASMLLKHVNDLLDVAKLDAGRMAASYAELDVAKLVRLVASHFDALAPQRHIAYAVETPQSLLAQIDPEKLERVLLNLLSNAFKYVPDGGRVKLSLSCSEQDRLLLRVQDSGPGVPAELREAVFERFRQAEGGSTRQFGGTGLGLSIASDFVQLHDGTIAVSDAPGGGALFQVEMPLSAPEGAHVRRQRVESVQSEAVLKGALEELTAPAPAAASAVAVSHAAASAPSVLVVEDNAEMQRFIAQTLAEHFRVETAANGRDGLRCALERHPDLIVTDLMMPIMSGDQMVAELRKHRELDAVPLLVLSAKADDALRMRLLREGAQDYLVKPFSAEELIARCRNLSAMKRTGDILRAELSSQEEDVTRLAAEIADRKQGLQMALEAARAARAEAERAGQVREAFLRMASHELRTPITTVNLDLQALSKSAENVTPERLRKLLERSGRSLQRLHATIESVLDYTRIQSGTFVAEPVTFQPERILQRVSDELTRFAEQKLVGLHLVAPPHVPVMVSDVHLVRLTLRELVTNAIVHTRGGQIEVGLRYKHESSRHCFWVKDNGPGIPAEEQEGIFEPFHQLERVEQKHTPGLGLGLALVRETVSLLRGSLELQSEVGRGTTVTLELPRLQ